MNQSIADIAFLVCLHHRLAVKVFYVALIKVAPM